MRGKKKKVPDNRLAEFESFCREWMGLFGLGDWTATFEWMGNRAHRAEVTYNILSRQAVFGLSRAKVPSRELRMSALHEVMHVLFADLSGMAEGACNAEVVLREEHRIISRVENWVVGMEGKR
jgi:hypothetical protein